MKFIHISDLHLGKRVNKYSMIEDQKYILEQIINIIENQKPQGILIAGDIYDKSVPPVEAVQLFDDFLSRVAKKETHIFIISGNHDSVERVSFGSRLMEGSGVHIAQVYNGERAVYSMTDEYGKLNVYLLPFIKPVHVRKAFEDEEVDSYTQAMDIAISKMDIDRSERNILVTHQFVTGSVRCESEDISVGGSDNVDSSVFEPFDYVALGHIHSPQNCKSEKIRYCGTPLKYSFSEANDEKSVTVVELKEKGDLKISLVPLVPIRDMVEIKGEFEELMDKSFYEGKSFQNDYVHITLTDEEDIVNGLGRLRTVYHNIMKLDYDNTRTRERAVIDGNSCIESKSPMELFSDFYQLQNNLPLSESQQEIVKGLIEKIWEDEK